MKDSYEYSSSINGFRGLAILMVIGFHFQLPLFANGYWGVDLFFWISGLLITQRFILEYSKTRRASGSIGQIDVRHYFLRRIRRVLPLSIFVLGALVIYQKVILQERWSSVFNMGIPYILSGTYNLYLSSGAQNYFDYNTQNSFYLHYWTLSLEEQIYFLAPFMFYFAVSFHGKKVFGFRPTWISRLLSIYSFLTLTSFIYFLSSAKTNQVSIFYSTTARYWEFGLGCICAVLHHKESFSRLNHYTRNFLISSSIILGSVFFFFNNLGGFFYAVAFPLIAASLFFLASAGNKKRTFFLKFLESTPMQFLGKISFPLYLLHWPAFILIEKSPLPSGLVSLSLYIIGIVLLSFILHIYVESPFLRINLDKFRRQSSIEPKEFIHSKVKRNRHFSGLIILVFVFAIICLENPDTARIKVNAAISYLTSDRYGTLTSVSGTNNNPNLNEKSEAQIVKEGDSASVDVIPEPIRKSVDEFEPANPLIQKPTTLDRWMNQLRESVSEEFLPKGYDYNQKVLMDEVRKSWANGCLNMISVETACTIGSGFKDVFLIGDSFAFGLVDSISNSMPGGWKLTILTQGSCLPWDVKQFRKDGTFNQSCSDHNARVQKYVLEEQPDLIIASGADQWLVKSSFSEWKNGFASTVSYFSKNSKKILVVSTTPGAGDLETCLEPVRSIRACFGNSKVISNFTNYQNSFSQLQNYSTIDLTQFLCYKDLCPPVLQNVPVYADSNHFSKLFSIKFAMVLTGKSVYSFD